MNDHIRYLLDTKTSLDELCRTGHQWDCFLSAYNTSDRVQQIFQLVPAKDKIWLLHPDYGYSSTAITGIPNVNASTSFDEDTWCMDVFDPAISTLKPDSKICIDITGMMRPHLLFLLPFLKARGFSKFDMIYTEPAYYADKSETSFSKNEFLRVKQIAGYEGNHKTDMTNDVLVVGIGYDHNLISHILVNRAGAKVIHLYSLPSLSADMYQESILRLSRVSESPSRLSDDFMWYASANDPFIVASTLSLEYGRFKKRNQISNLYLCPLATKPQVLGFGLFYMNELVGSASSIIIPITGGYEKVTSRGVGRAWVYPVDLTD